MKNVIKGLIAAGGGLFGLVYLLNPGAGFLEIIPDYIPVFGNLDEAAATALLIAALSYFGVDLTRIFRGFRKADPEVASRKARVIDADEATSEDA